MNHIRYRHTVVLGETIEQFIGVGNLLNIIPCLYRIELLIAYFKGLEKYSEECFSCFCQCIESQWSPKQYLTLLTFILLLKKQLNISLKSGGR